MVKAVVNGGEIRPLEPLPADWVEGQPLCVEKADDGEVPINDVDRDFAVLSAMCATSDAADEDRLEQALQGARRQAKDRMRAHMGLS